MGPLQLSAHRRSCYREITTIDAHTEGEPLRIITGGYPEVQGHSMVEKRQYLMTHLDEYRQLLMYEPRGHADMYGALITEPVTAAADFGVLFLHNEGYSSMCGHAVLALATVCCETGAIEMHNGVAEIGIDAPAGFIRAKAERQKDGTIRASFINVASWAEALELHLAVAGIGPVTVDIGFGGAYYAYVDADVLGLACTPQNINQIIDWGQRIKHAAMAALPIKHPLGPDLGFLYGTIFTSSRTLNAEAHSRQVCVFANGEVDRSPTGTGVAGRLALLYAKGMAGLHHTLMFESIVGGLMTVEGIETCDFHGKQALYPRVTGRAFITGEHRFLLHPQDIFPRGFLLG